MNNITSFYLAGLAFRPTEDIEKISKGAILKLEAEPDNPYDSNAIKILLQDNTHIGYIPKEQTKELHLYRICDIPLFSQVVNYMPEMPTYRRVLVAIKSQSELPKYIPEEQNQESKTFVNLDKLIGE